MPLVQMRKGKESPLLWFGSRKGNEIGGKVPLFAYKGGKGKQE